MLTLLINQIASVQSYNCSQEINNVDIGFSPTQNLGEKSDVITIGSTGSVQDGHIVK